MQIRLFAASIAAISAMCVGILPVHASGGPARLCFTPSASKSVDVPMTLTPEQESLLQRARFTKEGYYSTIAAYSINNQIKRCLDEGKTINGFTVVFSPSMAVDQVAVYASTRRWYSINSPGKFGSKLMIEGSVKSTATFNNASGYTVQTSFTDMTGKPQKPFYQ
jgi:hypothetical protein